MMNDPQPISTFDPSKSALLHDCRTDCVLIWHPGNAEEWRNTARPHPQGVQSNGYVFDTWATRFEVP